MGAAIDKRWEGALVPEVVSRWDPGAHYLSRSGSMRYGTVGAGEKAPGGGPGVTFRTGAGDRVGGASIGAVG